jgi:hypothetical protein
MNKKLYANFQKIESRYLRGLSEGSRQAAWEKVFDAYKFQGSKISLAEIKKILISANFIKE